jgi:hypothetical protein
MKTFRIIKYLSLFSLSLPFLFSLCWGLNQDLIHGKLTWDMNKQTGHSRKVLRNKKEQTTNDAACGCISNTLP